MAHPTWKNASAYFGPRVLGGLLVAATAGLGLVLSSWHENASAEDKAIRAALHWILGSKAVSALASALLISVPLGICGWLWKDRRDALNKLAELEDAEDEAAIQIVNSDQLNCVNVILKHDERGTTGIFQPSMFWDLFLHFGPRLKIGIPRRVLVADVSRQYGMERLSFDTDQSDPAKHLKSVFGAFVATMTRANLLESVDLGVHIEADIGYAPDANNSYRLTPRGIRLFDKCHGTVPELRLQD